MTFLTTGILILQLSAAQQAAFKVGTTETAATRESLSHPMFALLDAADQPLPLTARPAASLAFSTTTAEKQGYPLNSVTSALPDSSDSLEGIRIDAPVAPFESGTKPVKDSKRPWLWLTLAQHSAATFDAWSTRRAIARGNWETDPVLRPFVHSSSIYGAIQIGPTVLDLLGHHMRRSQNNWMRCLWWIPQAVSTGGFLYAGAHNLSVTR